MVDLSPEKKHEQIPTPEAGSVDVAPAVPEQQEIREQERQPEQIEQQQEPQEQSVDTSELSQRVAQAQTQTAPAKDPVVQDVEDILSDGLKDMYLSLDPATQKTFKQKGEETAGQIQQMIVTGKVRARKILDLIRDWLRIIPGVNKFFLEQEAKIKTDRVAAYIERKKQDNDVI